MKEYAKEMSICHLFQLRTIRAMTKLVDCCYRDSSTLLTLLAIVLLRLFFLDVFGGGYNKSHPTAQARLADVFCRFKPTNG